MGATYSLVAKACDPEVFRKSSRAILARRILASWNSNDLWSCYRAVKEAELSDAMITEDEVGGILGLRDAQFVQLWEIFSVPTPKGNVVPKKELFTALALFCGARCDDKIRFLLTVFDNSQLGLLSLTELHQMISMAISILGKASGVITKAKQCKEALLNSLTNDTAVGRGYQSSAESAWSTPYIGLMELEEFFRPLIDNYEELPIASHPTAQEASKRSPSLSPKKKKIDMFMEEEVVDENMKKKMKEEETVVVSPPVIPVTPTLPAVSEDWAPLCLSMDGILPNKAKNYHKLLVAALGTQPERVAIHHISPPFMYFTVGGPKSDSRSSENLAFLLHSQLASPFSYLRKQLPSAKLALKPFHENDSDLEQRIAELEKTLNEQTTRAAEEEAVARARISELHTALASYERTHAVPPIAIPPPAFASPVVFTRSTSTPINTATPGGRTPPLSIQSVESPTPPEQKMSPYDTSSVR